METYRSGHNGADSKSVREQSPASSNLAVSAKAELLMQLRLVFYTVLAQRIEQLFNEELDVGLNPTYAYSHHLDVYIFLNQHLKSIICF